MDKKTAEVEKILYAADFSKGRKKVVWDKVLSRLPRGTHMLDADELDYVAAAGPFNTQKKDRRGEQT